MGFLEYSLFLLLLLPLRAIGWGFFQRGFLTSLVSLRGQQDLTLQSILDPMKNKDYFLFVFPSVEVIFCCSINIPVLYLSLGAKFFVEAHSVGKEHCLYLDNQMLLFSWGAFQLILFRVYFKTNGRDTSKHRVLLTNDTKDIFCLFSFNILYFSLMKRHPSLFINSCPFQARARALLLWDIVVLYSLSVFPGLKKFGLQMCR